MFFLSKLMDLQIKKFSDWLLVTDYKRGKMYIKSSSEPPEQPDLNSKNGLRGGFPIKINGYAL